MCHLFQPSACGTKLRALFSTPGIMSGGLFKTIICLVLGVEKNCLKVVNVLRTMILRVASIEPFDDVDQCLMLEKLHRLQLFSANCIVKYFKNFNFAMQAGINE